MQTRALGKSGLQLPFLNFSARRGVGVAKLALRFSLANPNVTTTVAVRPNPESGGNWAKWAAEPIDQQLLAEVQAIFQLVKIGHTEELAKNN